MSDTQWSAPEVVADGSWTTRRSVDGRWGDLVVRLSGDYVDAFYTRNKDAMPDPSVHETIALLRASRHPAWLAAVEQEIWELRAMVNVLRADRDATVTKLATAQGLLRDAIPMLSEIATVAMHDRETKAEVPAIVSLSRRITAALDGAP